MIFENKERGWLLELGDLSQEKAEIVAEAVYEAVKTPLHRNSAIVRAAVRAGWIVRPELLEDGIKAITPPAFVNWLANNISNQFLEAITVPKNS